MGLPVTKEWPVETPSPWAPTVTPAWWPATPSQAPAKPEPAPVEPVRGPEEVPA